jgi:serine/threonine protein phosphatase PrpC
MTTASYTSQGGRPVNEDSLYLNAIDGEHVLAIVTDGLGGHGGGDLASKLAISTVTEELAAAGVDEDSISASIQLANERIFFQLNKARTTIALVSVSENDVYAANVGDTRIYQFRDGKIIHQSTDHSVCQMMVTIGEITPEQIRGHEERNKLLRALGGGDDVRMDIEKLDVQHGDAFLLCSDGFWELILEDEMIKTLKESNTANDWLSSMRKIVDEHIDANSDNNTAIVFIV